MDQRTLTQKWLRENVVSYPAGDRVYADIDAALLRFPSLRPKSDVYTYDDGRTQLLLCVHGLLPITFRGQSYNIPIAVWLSRDYPREPPLPYVVPTADMLVKPGPNLDVSGRSSIDYVQQWARKSEACSLGALIDAMQAEFSRVPPVYAKPKEGPSQRPQVSPQRPQASPQTPQPPAQPPQVPTRPGQPPSLPPKPQTPQTPHAPQTPQTPLNPGQYTPPTAPNPGQYNPPYVHLGPRIQSPASPIPTPTPAHATPAPQYHRQQPPLPPQPHVDTTANPPQYRAPHYPQQAWAPQQPTPPPPPPPPPQQPPIPIPVLAPQAYTPTPPPNLIDEDTAGPPLLTPQTQSAPAPPRPPNPELLSLHAALHSKLTSELASLEHAFALDAERLRAHQADLLAGEPALRDEMARLEAVRDVCRTAAGRMRAAVEAAERNVAELKSKNEPEVDELVCSTTIVHNQLINLVAEDNAIEDTIFHLSKALNSGRIDLDRFLRSTRLLAEEQFMKRALIDKICSSIPMGQQQLGY